jgi:metacaspase-1
MKKFHNKLFLILFILFTGIISNAQTKRGLIIAIENYPFSSKWETLNALNDVSLVKNALLKQDFKETNIAVLTDSMADKKGIEKALDQLLKNAGPGDIVVIHYSGHGQQIEDDNIDEEVDGLDECIVPYGAIKSNDVSIFNEISAGYFRDDVFGEKITLLRNKLGKKGNVLVTLDACHSGSGTRGGGPKVRGSSEPIVSSNFKMKKRGLKDTAGVFKDNNNITLNADAATYVVISAAQAQELNHETKDDDYNVVGSLSYAISKSLSTLNEKLTYRALFARIEDILVDKAPEQKPVLEGDGLDDELFGGDYNPQKAYVTAKVDITNKKLIRIDGGYISGITKGSVLSFYPAGTMSPEGVQPIVKGVVENSKYYTSTVRLAKAIPGLDKKTLMAFVSELNYGTKKIKLGTDSLSRGEAALIKTSLKNYQLVDLTTPYDLYFGKSDSGNGWALRYPGTGGIFSDNIKPGDTAELKKILKRYDRYRYLRNLTYQMPGLSAKVFLVHVDSSGNNDFEKTKERSKLGSLEVKVGEAIRPVVINTGTKPFYVNIVDMQPNGIINAIIPHEKKNITILEHCLVAPKDTLEITTRSDFKIRISPPYGEETFKIFISAEAFDLQKVLVTKKDITTRGNLKNLEKIFNDSEVNEIGARGTPTITMDKDGTILNLNFRIVPN